MSHPQILPWRFCTICSCQYFLFWHASALWCSLLVAIVHIRKHPFGSIYISYQCALFASFMHCIKYPSVRLKLHRHISVQANLNSRRSESFSHTFTSLHSCSWTRRIFMCSWERVLSWTLSLLAQKKNRKRTSNWQHWIIFVEHVL
jgi:hypothetical protein